VFVVRAVEDLTMGWSSNYQGTQFKDHVTHSLVVLESIRFRSSSSLSDGNPYTNNNMLAE